MPSDSLLDFARRANLQPPSFRAAGEIERIEIRMHKASQIALPDGGMIFAPIVQRPILRNEMTTAAAILREIAELIAKGHCVVITQLRLSAGVQSAGDRPCDSE